VGVDAERVASEFDTGYYRGLLEKAGEKQRLFFCIGNPLLRFLILARSLEEVGLKRLIV
jgi:hypothetical protein